MVLALIGITLLMTFAVLVLVALISSMTPWGFLSVCVIMLYFYFARSRIK